MEKKKTKVNQNTRILLALTVLATFVGISFGKILDNMLIDPKADSLNANSTQVVSPEAGATPVADESLAVNEENTIYLMQLGVFKTYDNLLTLIGDVQTLGYQFGVVKTDGNYVAFSHVSGSKELLADVEKQLIANDLTYFIKDVVVPEGDLKWEYFLNAVKQKPYEMESEFIQSFTNDDLHIFGYYTTLSNASFEPLASERQKMLLEIYQWLIE
ncbi:MAG: sporulation protein [Turicibacter sp.]